MSLQFQVTNPISLFVKRAYKVAQPTNIVVKVKTQFKKKKEKHWDETYMTMRYQIQSRGTAIFAHKIQFQNNPLSSICSTYKLTGVVLTLEHDRPTEDHVIKEN